MTVNVSQYKQQNLQPLSGAGAGVVDAYARREAMGDFNTNLVIEFAKVRLHHVNSWLNRQLTNMKNGAADTDALNRVLTALASYPEGVPADKWQDIKNALDQAIGSLPPDSATLRKLISLRDDPGSAINFGGKDILKPEIEALTRDLQSTLKSVDQRSQEDQLYINQKMGEMGEILQLAASLIQNMNETVKAILGRS